MEASGLVERAVLPPPAGSAVYQLTELGKGLEPALSAIGRWGARLLRGGPRKTDVMVPRAYFVAMRRTFNPQAAAGLQGVYELRIDDLVFEVRIRDRRISTREGQASHPDAVITMDVKSLNALLFRLLTPKVALESGRVHLTGAANALEQFMSVFAFHGLTADQPGAPAARGALAGARRPARDAG